MLWEKYLIFLLLWSWWLWLLWLCNIYSIYNLWFCIIHFQNEYWTKWIGVKSNRAHFAILYRSNQYKKFNVSMVRSYWKFLSIYIFYQHPMRWWWRLIERFFYSINPKPYIPYIKMVLDFKSKQNVWCILIYCSIGLKKPYRKKTRLFAFPCGTWIANPALKFI